MNVREREAARLGIAALNGSLVELGYAPVGESRESTLEAWYAPYARHF
jgi:hypothetical protein